MVVVDCISPKSLAELAEETDSQAPIITEEVMERALRLVTVAIESVQVGRKAA